MKIVIKTLKRQWPRVSIVFILLIALSMFFWPGILRALGMAIIAIVQQHLRSYQPVRTSGVILVRNMVPAIIGLFITFSTASYLGRQAGAWAGIIPSSRST